MLAATARTHCAVTATVPMPAVSMTMHAENRARLVKALKGAGVPTTAVVLLAGGPAVMRHETDHEVLFRQESNFHWAFGVKEPDFFGTIDVGTGAAALFVPRLPASYAVWMGAIKSLDAWRALYEVCVCRGPERRGPSPGAAPIEAWVSHPHAVTTTR